MNKVYTDHGKKQAEKNHEAIRMVKCEKRSKIKKEGLKTENSKKSVKFCCLYADTSIQTFPDFLYPNTGEGFRQ